MLIHSMQLTISAIKADVGSIGGHTRPSAAMMDSVREVLDASQTAGLIIDGAAFHIGDDIALIMSHTRGPLDEYIHTKVALVAFRAATEVAKREGLYGAGQDLLLDAPSGNLRGAGPGVAEITFEHDSTTRLERRAESLMVFMMDKCGPGALNLPLYLAFADPMYCSGLMLQPQMHKGFAFRITDMDESAQDSVITLQAPDDLYDIATLLRDNDKYGIESIWSRQFPDQQAAAVSTERLHTIAGKYVGKDDPIAIVRNQGIMPAPEEIVSPWMIAHYVGGGARGGHNMPLMPVAVNTAVTGPYCLPLVAALGFSMAANGMFASQHVDFFDNPAWDHVRDRAQHKAIEIRRQGFSGPAMLPESELEYGGVKEVLDRLRSRFAQPEWKDEASVTADVPEPTTARP